MSIKNICKVIKLSDKCIRYVIKELIEKEYIIKESLSSGKKQANTYFINKHLLLSNKSIAYNSECFNNNQLILFFNTNRRYFYNVFNYLKSKEIIKIKHLKFILIYIFMKAKKSNLYTLQENRLYLCDRYINAFRKKENNFLIDFYNTLYKFKIKFKKEGYTIPDELINLLKKIKEKVKEKGLERKLKPKTFRKKYKKKEVKDSLRQELIDLYDDYFKKAYKRRNIGIPTAKINKMLSNLIKYHKDEIDLIKDAFKDFIERWDYIKEDYKLKDQYPIFEVFIKIKNTFLNDVKNRQNDDEEKWF